MKKDFVTRRKLRSVFINVLCRLVKINVCICLEKRDLLTTFVLIILTFLFSLISKKGSFLDPHDRIPYGLDAVFFVIKFE